MTETDWGELTSWCHWLLHRWCNCWCVTCCFLWNERAVLWPLTSFHCALFWDSSSLAALPLASQYIPPCIATYQGLLHSFPLPALSTHQEPEMCVGFDLGLAPEYSNSIFCLPWLAGAPLKLTVNLNIETLSVGSYFFPSQHTIFQWNQPVWGGWFSF